MGRGGVFGPLENVEFFRQVQVDSEAGPLSGLTEWASVPTFCTASPPGNQFAFLNTLEYPLVDSSQSSESATQIGSLAAKFSEPGRGSLLVRGLAIGRDWLGTHA